MASAFVCILLIACSAGAQSVGGVYRWRKNGSICITLDKDDSFVMTRSVINQKIDTLAECSVSKVRNNLYEINSKFLSREPELGLIHETDTTLNENARVGVLIPNIKDTLEAELVIDYKKYIFNITDGKGSVDVPCYEITYIPSTRRKKNVVFHQRHVMKECAINSMILKRTSRSYAFNRGDLSYSRLSVDVMNQEIRDTKLKSKDIITFYIPDIGPEHFEMYYIVGDFFRIQDNTLFWKGEEFVRDMEEEMNICF